MRQPNLRSAPVASSPPETDSGFLKQSNDQDHCYGCHRHNGKQDIPQVCHGDVFQVVFHLVFMVAPLAITRGD